MDTGLNPDGPHSPDHTREVGQLFDDASRFLCYATMAGKGGLKYPSHAYSLVADFYAATARMDQACVSMAAFLRRLEGAGLLEAAPGSRPVPDAVDGAVTCLGEAATLLESATAELQAAQNAMSGLRGKEDPDGDRS